MTGTELADLVAHGDPDAAVAAMLAGRWRVEVRPDGRTVAVLPTDPAAEVAR